METGQGVDHVADVAEDDAVVEIAEDAGQEHAQDDVVPPAAGRMGEEIDDEANGGGGDSDEQQLPPLAQAEDRAAVLAHR